jgi:hypothetical protein
MRASARQNTSCFVHADQVTLEVVPFRQGGFHKDKQLILPKEAQPALDVGLRAFSSS